jgi:hypothetical protein
MTEQERSPQLVGNRFVLAGAVMYLLEWIAIIGASVEAPNASDVSAAKVLDGYVDHQDALVWAAGFWSVVLLGRVLIVIGLRKGLVDSGRHHGLSDLAVVAMAVSVTIEVVTYGIVGGTAVVANHDGGADLVRALDSVAFTLNAMIFGPLGVAVVAASWAMLRSGLFSKYLCWVGLLGGALLAALGLAFTGAGSAADALQVGVPLFWIWMLWAGVVMWRQSPALER